MDKGMEQNSLDKASPFLEKQWTRRVRERGDRDAFKKIFRAYYKRLHGFAKSYVGNIQEAEDIVQSVFLNIWAQRESWNPSISLKSYLFNAVKNEALNVLRHKRVVDDTEDDVIRKFKELKESNTNKKGVEAEELRQDIEEAIDDLPPRCRQIFMLSRKSGLTYNEIAQVLDLSIGTINTQMGRALKRLRNHLSDYFIVAISFGLYDWIAKIW